MIIALMAKYPETGRVKTRLARSIGDKKAVEVYRFMLMGTASVLLEVEDVQTCLAYTPESLREKFVGEFPGFDYYYPQHGDSLGKRMLNMIDRLLSLQEKAPSVILIGADMPELSTRLIRDAVIALRNHDLVLGPTSDGGYYLIGMSRQIPELFNGPHWGTAEVWKTTLEIARTLNLDYAPLEKLADCDTIQDYREFQKRGFLP
jgi:rSAM/selenodomain-associated transferase 1